MAALRKVHVSPTVGRCPYPQNDGYLPPEGDVVPWDGHWRAMAAAGKCTKTELEDHGSVERNRAEQAKIEAAKLSKIADDAKLQAELAAKQAEKLEKQAEEAEKRTAENVVEKTKAAQAARKKAQAEKPKGKAKAAEKN